MINKSINGSGRKKNKKTKNEEENYIKTANDLCKCHSITGIYIYD